jgi:hypothetical protein
VCDELSTHMTPEPRVLIHLDKGINDTFV